MSSADSGIAVGLNKGFITTKRARKLRPSQRKGKLARRTALVRQVARAVAGYAPYERRIVELLKGGGNNPQKRAWRFAKKRLGTHKRAKAKIGELQDMMNKGDKQE